MRRPDALSAFAIGVGLACAVALLRAAMRVPALAPLDPNEGWNAYHALAAIGKGPLYPEPESLYFNNYPPLSFYLVGWLSRLTNDAIAAGRALSIASFAVVIAATGSAARGIGASRTDVAFACAFLAATFLLYSHYVGIDDPQLFGHALATSAMAIALRRPGNPHRAGVAAALCALALFVKPNLLAVPLALLIWIASFHRRAVAAYVGVGLATAATLLAGCFVLYGADFLSHLLSPRLYSLYDAWHGSVKWLSKTAPFYLPVALLAWRSRRDGASAWCLVYASISSALGFYFVGGSGVDQNVFFDAYIAFAMTAAVALTRMQQRGWLIACCSVPLAVSAVVQFQREWIQPHDWTQPAASQAFAESIGFVRSQPGPAACAEQALCFRAGKRRSIDFVNVAQYLVKGRLDERLLTERIATQSFGVVQLTTDPVLDSAIGEALNAHYSIARRDGWGVYYVPKTLSRAR